MRRAAVKWFPVLLGFLLLVLILWILTSNFVTENIAMPPESRQTPPESRQRPSWFNSTLPPSPANVINLSWVTFSDPPSGPHLHNVFLFISAYYDSRNVIEKNRPAVAVVGYVMESAPKPKLLCHFTYANGSSGCLGEAKRELVNHYLLHEQNGISAIKQAVNELLLCPVSEGDPVPTAVRFSRNHCELNSFSKEIPVNNAKLPMNKIGVCLQGCLRQSGQNFVDRLDNFISMCQTLGAEFITMYASPDEVQGEVIEHLLTNYSHVVNLVQWKVFESRDYHGQGGIMHDCLYRHMMAEYLVMIDLDEMIIPFNHLKWMDMLEALEDKGGQNYAGYSFENRFFLPRNGHISRESQQCRGVGKRPSYLESTNELDCAFGHGERSKYIIKPNRVIHAAVHEICEALSPHLLYPVSNNVAVNAHYRKARLQKCLNSKLIDKYDLLSPLLKRYAENYCV